ncbi:hypothetical protein BGZ67_007210 [Mortierella alpina]|nr:hypothetical protein BGZ67_007210 [Mortierella alpina]
MSSHVCPSYDDQHDPADSLALLDGGLAGKRHIIGWVLSGFLALVATLVSFHLLYRHAKNYNKPSEQRHIMRIVLMIPIYAVISFLSYRFYKGAMYFETIRDCYEAFVMYSFFVLLLTYLGDDNETQRSKITGPDRRKLLYPLNCFYYSPHHENFLYVIKYCLLLFVITKPLTTISAVVLEYFGLYCQTTYSIHFGMLYITIINFIVASVALYALVLFYQTIAPEIQEHDPFMKFMCVKAILVLLYYQVLTLSLLGTLGYLPHEDHWTVLEVEEGISAILITFEMVVFAFLHVYAYSYRPYVVPGVKTPLSKSLIDAFNPIDMVREAFWACHDITLLIQGQPLPIRDGHLSGKLERAQTIRIRKRDRFFKHRKPKTAAPTGSVDPRLSVQNPSPLSAGGVGALVENEEQVRARLLDHPDVQQYNNLFTRFCTLLNGRAQESKSAFNLDR